MRKNKQHIVDAHKGDCFRACMTSILDVPNDIRLPKIEDPDWFFKWSKLLRTMGMDISYSTTHFWRRGYWIATVPSLNFENGLHAIVMKDTEVAHDPSTKKRYEVGTKMLGNEEYKVRGGYLIEVIDASKLWKYEKFKKKYTKKKN